MRSKPVLIVETPPRDVLEAASNKAATYGALATMAFSYRFNVFQTSGGGETARPIARSKPRQGEGGEPARVLEALEDMGVNTQIVNDASARHMVNDLSFLNGWARLRRVMYCPAETSADALIVRLAMDNDALMMSNDGFAEWREKYPGLTERLVKFSFTPGYIYLYMGGTNRSCSWRRPPAPCERSSELYGKPGQAALHEECVDECGFRSLTSRSPASSSEGVGW